MLETDLAYIAGIVDGEGCIRIKKAKAYRCQGRVTPGYHASIQIKMVDEPAIRFIAETLGGWYYKQEKNCKGGRLLYCWAASDKKAADIIRTLLPYLRIKKTQAEAVLELRQLQSEGMKHRTKVTGYRNFPNKYGTPRQVANYSFSDEYVERCDSLYRLVKELKRA